MAQTKNTSSKNTSSDVGESEVQEKFDKINEQGYVGTAVDQTPNEAYTLDGVTSGMETPETDPALSEQAQEEGEK